MEPFLTSHFSLLFAAEEVHVTMLTYILAKLVVQRKVGEQQIAAELAAASSPTN